MPVSRPRRFFGFFLIAQKETRRRSGETLCLSRDISPSADGDLLCPHRQSRQNAAGGRGFWERPAAYALVFQEPLSTGPPVNEGRGYTPEKLVVAAGAVPS